MLPVPRPFINWPKAQRAALLIRWQDLVPLVTASKEFEQLRHFTVEPSGSLSTFFFNDRDLIATLNAAPLHDHNACGSPAAFGSAAP